MPNDQEENQPSVRYQAVRCAVYTRKSTEEGLEQEFLMELDPLYCDVIVQRWEKFTGGKAEQSGS
ncbi:MAG TPA: hypothetical protein VG826_00665 [Pirellulales bacterium]|nr:hypothetical protein [Pirellulales bacterium]